MFKNRFFPIVVLSLITVFIFHNLPYTFYQQDEWQTLGHNFVKGIGVFSEYNPFKLLFGEVRPLSTVLYLFLLGFFKFTIVPSAIFGILFHIINATLTFYFVGRITKKKLIAFIASVFFITNSISHQAVTWASAIGTLPAATLILISIIMYFKYLEKTNKKYLFISFISAILSLYFKGIGLFLFVLIPLILFIYKGLPITKKNIISVLSINLPLLVFGLVMILVRFAQVFFNSEKVAGYASGTGNNSFVPTVILHSILYPLTSLFQIFVPPLDLYSITPSLTVIQYKFLTNSPLKDLVAQSITADMVAVLGAFVILFFLGFIVYKSKDRAVGRNIFFALTFFFLSFIPYVALDRDSSYLSSRYFYLALVPAGLLLGYVVSFFTSINKYVKWAALFLLILYFSHHAFIIRGDINYQVKLGNERKAVLAGIKKEYPILGNKNIFYVTSDKQFYGDITNPFQNGLGYVLEVWYYDSGKIPKEFLTKNFLWDLGSEGYREKGNYGFGYFQDIDKMAKVMGKDKLSISTVHAFLIKSKSNEVISINKEVKEKLATISAIPK